ncbi:MAG: hypothetical protein ABI134_26300 [Byssovorax sp.]
MFIESYDRADVTIATPVVVEGVMRPNENGPVCVPIELKTTGTWWGSSPGAIAKALQEPGKKRLADDLAALAQRRRSVVPFGVVALLITDVEGDAAALQSYITHAAKIAASCALNEAWLSRS